MRPILFHLPIFGIPIYGYGLMLFCAFLFCNLLARRLCKREGIDGSFIPDLAIHVFVGGIIGSRFIYVIQFPEKFFPWYWNNYSENTIAEMLRLWDGGLVFYGGVFGGLIGYGIYTYFVLRKAQVPNWKLADALAPCLALGVAFGRTGCLFTGCCYGNAACETCPAIHFPHASPAWGDMVHRGYQTPYGFILQDYSLKVTAVEPRSAADGIIKVGDIILAVNDQQVFSPGQIVASEEELKFKVFRNGAAVDLPSYAPTSIGVHPTQIYEVVSVLLLLFFLLSYYPFKRHHGELLVLFMLGYGMERFLNEMLRIDNEVVALGMTLSQNISLVVIVAAIALGVFVWRRPLISAEQPPNPEPLPPETAKPGVML